MEVSSHGLAQGRVQAVRFDAAVFTNLTRDHLDFHGDMASYGAAKASLFERGAVRLRVFNVDDAFGAALAARGRSPAASPAVGRRGRQRRILFARDIEYTATGTAFTLESSFGSARFTTALLGEFNVDNVLAVLAVLLGSGVALHEPRRGAGGTARAVRPPRDLRACRCADRGSGLRAHARTRWTRRCRCCAAIAPASSRVVFGCGGDRDRGKRPEMGAIAARRADRSGAHRRQSAQRGRRRASSPTSRRVSVRMPSK